MLFIPDGHIKITDQDSTGTRGEIQTNTNTFKRGEWVGTFSGVNVTLDYVLEHMPVAKQSQSSNGTTGAEQFFKSYDEAIQVYRHTPEQVISFTENDVRLEGGDAGGLDIQYDVTGDFIDIDRYLVGEPEHFGSMDNGIPRGQRMTIIFNSGSVSGNSSADIIERGKRLVRLIDWLESQGVRIQLLAVDSTKNIHVEVYLKYYDEPVSLADIAVTSHTDWNRRLHFRIAEYSKTWSEGYGSSKVLDYYMEGMNYSKLSPALQDGHILYCGQTDMAQAEYIFNKLEQQLTTVLSDPHAEPQLFKVMV